MANPFWAEIDDLWSAKKACIQGSSIAFVVGAATSIITFLSLQGASLFPGIGRGSFLDAALFLVLSFFIYRCSRVASVFALLLYYFGQVMIFQQTHHFPTSAIFFGLLFISGVRGAFAYHEIKQGLSAEEIRSLLKTQREASEPKPTLTQKILAWGLLFALATGGLLWCLSATHKPKPRMVVRDSSQPTALSIPSEPVLVATARAVQSASLPATQSPRSETRSFKLRDGRTISGRVVTNDPLYYTVEISSGRQEIVIKEDIVS